MWNVWGKEMEDEIFKVGQSANLALLKESQALLFSTDDSPTDILIP